MPSNEERHEVAVRLRGAADVDIDDEGSFETVLFDLLKKPRDHEDAARRLADLIDPEPERTCLAVDTGEGIEAFECSECGWDGWGSRDSVTLYCPMCGASVDGLLEVARF